MLGFFFLFFRAQAEWWENSVVFDVTEENYQEVIGADRAVVLEFYAPFCHWCRVMFHEYEQVAMHYNAADSVWKVENILIARVNAQKNPKICEIYGVHAYPTIIFIPANSQHKLGTFDAPRVKFKFIDWIENNLKLPDDPHEAEKDPHSELEILELEEENQENHEEEHENEDRNEEFLQFEMLIEDVASHNSDKWRGEFNALQIQLEELRKLEESDNQEVILALYNVKTGFNEQMLKIFAMIEGLNAKLEGIDGNIKNRNQIESTQSRFNLTHSAIFATLGGIFGFVCGIYLVKIRPTKDYNKV